MDGYHAQTRRFLARHIKKTRKEHGLTQEKMAEYLGVSVRSYSDLENGRYCCSGPTLMRYFAMLPPEKVIHIVNEYHVLLKEEETEGERLARV